MKIYNKVVINLETNEVIYEDSFEYDGEIVSLDKGGGGGEIPDEITNIVRYAPYIEEHHSAILDISAAERAASLLANPYDDFVSIATVEAAFFGTGYAIANFPSLYDMYGKFMAGLDVDSLFDQIFEDTLNSPHIDNLVSVEATILDDDVDTNLVPRFVVGMRDINSVVSSSFVVGKGTIESARLRALAKFDKELRYKLIPVVTTRWQTHLEWNRNVVITFAEIMKFYYLSKLEVDTYNYGMLAEAQYFPHKIIDFERAVLGTLQGAYSSKQTKSGQEGGSQLGNALTGAASGALIGSQILPGWGTVIGGVIGGVAGLFG